MTGLWKFDSSRGSKTNDAVEVFDLIILPAPEAARRPTPEQTSHYSHYNTKLGNSIYFNGNSCHIALTKRVVAAILLLEIYWVFSLPPYLNNCSRTDGIKQGT